MEKYYALINNKLVSSIIIATDDFINNIQNQYDAVVDVTNRERPSIGDSYYLDTDIFVPNNLSFIQFPVDLEQEHLNTGTEDGFAPMQLSGHDVSYSDGVVTMGCKELDAATLLDALHKLLIEERQVVNGFTASEAGPGFGKFNITWEEAQTLYDALKLVRL